MIHYLRGITNTYFFLERCSGNMLKVQFQRLLQSKYLYISLILGCVLTTLHYFQIMRTLVYNDMSDLNKSVIPETAYLLWLNSNGTEVANLFLFILPVLAILPFGTQLLSDIKANYHQLMIMRSSKFMYLQSMVMISAVGGFMVIVIPLALNFLLFILTFPAISPDPFIYYMDGVYSFKTLFFTWQLNHPFLHTLFYIFLSGVSGGLFASLAASLALYFKFSILLLVTPLFFSLLFSALSELLDLAIAPMKFLDISSRMPVELWGVGLFAFVSVLCTGILLFLGGRKLNG